MLLKAFNCSVSHLFKEFWKSHPETLKILESQNTMGDDNSGEEILTNSSEDSSDEEPSHSANQTKPVTTFVSSNPFALLGEDE